MSTIVEQVLVPSIKQLQSLDAHDTTNWDLVIVSGTSLPLACHLCFISGCLPTLLHAVAFSLSLLALSYPLAPRCQILPFLTSTQDNEIEFYTCFH